MSDISNKVYKFFADYIFKNCGILYSENDYYRLDNRIMTLQRELEYSTVEELYNAYLMKVDSRMHSLLIDLATNNETSFFRDSKPFNALFEVIIPDMLKESPLKKIDIWCAGCSSGQEPYSIVMGAKERCAILKDTAYTIDASDISTEILSKAKSGQYTNLDVQRGLPTNYLVKYFDQNEVNNSWIIKNDLKQQIKFYEFNLLDAHYPVNKYDIIFCRNVLIYQNKENRLKILNGFFQALKPGGVLFMGSGESLIGFDIDLKQQIVNGSVSFLKDQVTKKVA